MPLRLQKLDGELVHEHICERYIELTSNASALQQDLGIVEKQKTHVSVDIEPPLTNSKRRSRKKRPPSTLDDRYNLRIQQSITSLHSSRDNNNSTTGYVLWSTTPFFLRWLLYQPEAEPFRNGGILEDSATQGILKPSAHILELGAGTAGIMPVVLGNYVGSYVCTDQRGLINRMQLNIKENLLQLSKRRCVSVTMDTRLPEDHDSDEALVYLETMPLDWETFQLSKTEPFPPLVPGEDCTTAYIMAMDVIYNDYLIEPFLKTLCQLVDFYKSLGLNTHVIVGVHLRAQEVVTDFLEKAILEYDLPFAYIHSEVLEASRFSLYYM